MKQAKLKFKTVIISDVHLGAPGCKIAQVNDFLKHVRCQKLILNGDIIDAWQIRRGGVWTKKHSKFIRLVLQMAEKRGTQVIYTRGNHDDVLDRFIPFSFGNISIVSKHVHETEAGRYLVIHGDVFDAITTRFKWIAKVGDIGYNLLLKLNSLYNRYRTWRGKEYYSLSAAIKAKVKGAVNFISSFEDTLVELAQAKGYRGVICGHIHTAADKNIGQVHYLNSGDWVESLTALVEHHDGRFEVIGYNEFLSRRQAATEAKWQRKAQKNFFDAQADDAGVSHSYRPQVN